MHHHKSLSEFNMELQSGNAQFGSKLVIFLSRFTLKFEMAALLYYVKFCASFQSHWFIQTGLTVLKLPTRVKIGNFLSCVTLKFDGWPWKIIGHFFYTTLSFAHNFKAIGEFKLELQSGSAQFGSKSAIFAPCDLEIWRMTLEKNRTPLSCYFKLFVSFRSHWWIQTGVTVPKRPIGVKSTLCCSRVTLKFDGWPWQTMGHFS